MPEVYYVIKQNSDYCYLTKKPNEILFESNDLSKATIEFVKFAKNSIHYPNEFERNIYLPV